MKKHDINRWVFEIPLEDIRTNDFRDEGYEISCICCGKEMKSVKYEVHLLTSGSLVSTDQPFSDDEDQGFFPIGNACKSKLPNNFYFKLQD